MALGEFSLIDRFFTYTPFGKWKSQGVGDDCALIDIGTSRIAVTTDMMAIGTHFFPDALPRNVGHKALATNLSDLAAAGATPRAFFLSIALPEADAEWLREFSAGMMELAKRYDCALLGGDTTRSVKVEGKQAPCTISITAMGEVKQGKGLTRSGAKPGDDIWVSGTLGGPYSVVQKRYGYWSLKETEAYHDAENELDKPEPRVELGKCLCDVASAAVDVSDGFAQDLMHILERSSVSAEIDYETVPMHPVLREMDETKAREAAFSGGDDYELVWTAPSSHRARIENMASELKLKLTRVGRIVDSVDGVRLRVLDKKGKEINLSHFGFDHFS